MLGLSVLPEEILVQIVSYLVADPPSVTQLRREPHAKIFVSDEKTLKHISEASKQLRRLVLPTLFRYARLAYASDEVPFKEDLTLRIEEATKLLRQFLVFMTKYELEATSVLLWVKTNASFPVYFSPRTPDLNNKIAVVWHELLSTLEPERIVILAPSVDLARLIGCDSYESLSRDKTTPDLGWQSLELCQRKPQPGDVRNPLYGIATKAPAPWQTTVSSVLHQRHWHQISLNEGSFLGAYGTLDWFERGAPHEIPSLLRYLFPQCCGQISTQHSHRFGRLAASLSYIDTFRYTAVFPPRDHVLLQHHFAGGVHHLHYLRELSLQLAPHPLDLGRMLGDDARVGRADLTECWDHVQGAYLELRRLLWASVWAENWRLRSVVCEDAAIESLSQDLRERFGNMFEGRTFPGSEEWKAWGKRWRIIEASDGPSLAVGD